MGKFIFSALIIAGYCFGQLTEEKKEPELCNDGYTKYLSLEIFGGTYCTFEHRLDEPAVIQQGVGLTPVLPLFIWYGGGRIDYKFMRTLKISLKTSYSRTGNLFSSYKIELPEWTTECKLNLTTITFSISYIPKTLIHLEYQIGTGIEFDYVKVPWVTSGPGYDSVIYRDTTSSASYLRPTFVGNIQLNISTALYMKTQIEASFYHFIKTGSQGIHLPLILPSLSIGLGYKFDLARSRQ